MASAWVGLQQIGRFAALEHVVLRSALPGGVVTWFVTGFAIAFSNWHLTETSRIGDEPKAWNRRSRSGPIVGRREARRRLVPRGRRHRLLSSWRLAPHPTAWPGCARLGRADYQWEDGQPRRHSRCARTATDGRLGRRHDGRWLCQASRSLRSPEDLLRSGLKACLRSDAVGDRPVVAGDYGRGVVDLVDEHGEGAGDAGLAGGFEGDGDRGGGEGDGSGEAADDGFAGDGAAFVVVAQVGVELPGQPVLGVVREQPQHHLQAAAPGAQHRGAGAWVYLVGGQFRRELVPGGDGVLDVLFRRADRAVGGGDRLVLGDRRGVRVGEQRREGTLGGGQLLFRVADPGVRGLACRVGGDLGVDGDLGCVVADLVDAVVLAGVLDQVLFPPPGLQPVQDVRRAGPGVGGEDLQHDLAVLEQGELPGFAVVLELRFLLGPGDGPGFAAGGDRGDDREHGRDG